MSKIFIVDDDLLNSKDNYIVHQVNNRGRMGSGVAAKVREHITDEDYINLYQAKVGTPESMGKVLIIPNKDNPNQVFLNLVGQDRYGYNGSCFTNYEAVEKGLWEITKIVPPGSAISFPYKMGAGLGGGNWNMILNLIIKILGKDYIIHLYRLQKNI